MSISSDLKGSVVVSGMMVVGEISSMVLLCVVPFGVLAVALDSSAVVVVRVVSSEIASRVAVVWLIASGVILEEVSSMVLLCVVPFRVLAVELDSSGIVAARVFAVGLVASGAVAAVPFFSGLVEFGLVAVGRVTSGIFGLVAARVAVGLDVSRVVAVGVVASWVVIRLVSFGVMVVA